MADVALLLNPNLSSEQALELIRKRAEHSERLISEMLDTAAASPEIAEPYLRSLADMPLLPVEVRTFASAALVAVQAYAQHREAKAWLKAFRERHARETAEFEARQAAQREARP